MNPIVNILLIIAVLCCGCATELSGTDAEITVIIDKTDPLKLYPTADAIIAPLGLKENPWQGVRVIVTFISDLDVNKTTVIVLDKQSEWSGNLPLRNAKVQHFQKELQQSLTAMKSTGSCTHSIIYRTIAKQANRLTASSATKKYLLIYSNLYENSDVNFYNPQIFGLLRKNPQSIQKRLEATVGLSNLAGVEVWLLYEPASYRENNNYMTIATFYQHLLQGHGAVVHIDNKFLLL